MENATCLKTQFKKYVIPSVAAMWVFSLYSMVDGIFVSKGVGSDALAAGDGKEGDLSFVFCVHG